MDEKNHKKIQQFSPMQIICTGAMDIYIKDKLDLTVKLNCVFGCGLEQVATNCI